ncbi:hypothetical protein AY599_18265 [Leptolyngbya valderiana BDU 20041]|nr:hypothetical protein AY599_18265 [Leptolyngbya valderiana BDU 20041]
MTVKISELPTVAAAETDHVLPASRAGATVGLTVQQLVNVAKDQILDGAPGALDTLNELAAAIADDENYAATVTTALAGKLAADGSVPWAADQNADGNSITDLLNLNGRAVSAIQSRMSTITDVANGATIPATDGIVVNMTGHTCYLPDATGLPTGFTVYLYAWTNYPSHKALWIAAQSGQNIYSHNVNVLAQTFYLVPSEVLRFTLTSSGYWIWEVLQNGKAPKLRARASGASYINIPTSLGLIPLSVAIDAFASISSSRLAMPWHGRYQFDAALDASPSGSAGYVYLYGVDTNNLTPLSTYSMNYEIFDTAANAGLRTLREYWSAALKTDDVAGAEFFSSVSGPQYLPEGCRVRAQFMGR